MNALRSPAVETRVGNSGTGARCTCRPGRRGSPFGSACTPRTLAPLPPSSPFCRPLILSTPSAKYARTQNKSNRQNKGNT